MNYYTTLVQKTITVVLSQSVITHTVKNGVGLKKSGSSGTSPSQIKETNAKQQEQRELSIEISTTKNFASEQCNLGDEGGKWVSSRRVSE